TRTRACTIGHYTSDRAQIRKGARDLLASFLDGRKIRLLGLRLSSFDEDRSRQASLAEFLVRR
ncbi:MAG TPA: hypothetical protein VE134_09390, partial [Methanomicrobiales archaeon]|nr:hypothetical protein [Methanomicrobiales archaeon]